MKLGTLRNPKFLRLARALDVGTAATAGHLEALWHFTSDFAPAGDVGKFADEEIEAACFWDDQEGHRRGSLVAALVETGWLDKCAVHRLVIHNWAKHAAEMVKKRNRRAGIEFAQLTALVPTQLPTPPHNGRQTADSDSRTADNGCPPDQTRPDLTPPDQDQSFRTASDANALKSTRRIPKPERFDEGPARVSITAWAKRRDFPGRILHEGQLAWESWGPAKDFTRPLSSWVGSFKGLINSKLADGTIKRETDEERGIREANEFHERSQQPSLKAVGDSDV